MGNNGAGGQLLAAVPKLMVSFACMATVAAILIRYPLTPWPLTALLIVYAAALCRWPVLFLVILPVVLPTLDLGMWTGWQSISEADLFVLTTLGTLILRNPPSRSDVIPPGWTGAIPVVVGIVGAIGVTIGLNAPLGDTGLSANPYLRADNALRLAKGTMEALILLPFLCQRQRLHADAATWLGCGVVAGLVAVTIIVVAERALFAGILDFGNPYRVAGPFSSMHVGGGHIGAYAALALPFALALPLLSLRWLPLGGIGGVGGTYTLIATFARTGYAAGLVGVLVTGLALARTVWRHGLLARMAVGIPFTLTVIAVAVAASSGAMRDRLALAAADMLTRESNWRAGWAVRDTGAAADLLGMGLGTYQRVMLSRATVDRPSDFGTVSDSAGPFVWVRMESPFYLGQKVVLPDAGAVHLTLKFRSESNNAALNWSLCDKVLLFSDNCQLGVSAASPDGAWKAVAATITVTDLGASVAHGLLRRPVELSLFGSTVNSRLALRDVSLTDDTGRQLLANGDFSHGMDRWLFTDDSHVSWRILNQYLMLLFESGVIGLTAYILCAGAAIAGGLRATFRGDPLGGAVAGSVTSFLVSGLFDNVLEAPRVATLYFLICWTGILLWRGQRNAA